MSYKYYFVDYTGSGEDFIESKYTVFGNIYDYGEGLIRTNVTGWVDNWNATELSYSQAQDFHNTNITNSMNNILPANHSDVIKYYYISYTGSMSEFIMDSDYTQSMPIDGYTDRLWRTKNTNWANRVGGVELSQSQAQDYYRQELSASFSNQLP